MKKAYLYPISAYTEKMVYNPYLDNFMNSLENTYRFVNRRSPSKIGFLDIVFNYLKVDCVFLNWIEDLPDKKGGWIQTLFFIKMFYLLKLRKVKMIWTMHNRLSHYRSNSYLKRFLFKFLLNKTDFILTHSKEGIRFAHELKIKKPGKILYLPHPLENRFLQFHPNPEYDILIWGSIIPYKGIDKFLEYLYNKTIQHQYRIKIAGKVKPSDYKDVINKFCNKNILLDDRYLPEEELQNTIANSKVVLFTYNEDSVLSSGVLMDTLSYGAEIIAPNLGAFKDLNEENIISTFNKYDDLILILNKKLAEKERNSESISSFIEENNWQKFADKLSAWII